MAVIAMEALSLSKLHIVVERGSFAEGTPPGLRIAPSIIHSNTPTPNKYPNIAP